MSFTDLEIIGLFGNSYYTGWQNNRVNFSVKLLGEDFFKGKTLLELGCGVGHVGRKFEALGAVVTYAEGKKDNFRILRDGAIPEDGVSTPFIGVGKEKCVLLDQNEYWDLGKQFDIIIHWGVSYHLDNWQQDLLCTSNHGNLILFETLVSDNPDSNYVMKLIEHPGMDQALSDGTTGGTGNRPSPAAVEKEFMKLGLTYTRYDTNELNEGSYHVYD